MKKPLFSYKLNMVFKFNTAKATMYANNFFNRANPFYRVFDENAEGCNFISQCILAGCENLSTKSCPDWFYENEKNYSTSWINVEELKKYLLSQNACGPIGRMINRGLVGIGDVVFFQNSCKEKSVGLVTKMVGEEIFFVTKREKTEELTLSQIEEKGFCLIHIIGVKK